jgi:hypothetical protein
MTPEETTRKSKFVKLVNDLAVIPNARNAQAVASRDQGIAFVKAEILTPETVALLGDDYEAIKTTIDALQ